MMDLVYNFDKNLQQRREEYLDVLNGTGVLPASALAKKWGFYLELAIDSNGWQAVWKISRTTCESLQIPFPTIVLVFVLQIDFSSLHALVKILAVQDDIHLPDKHYVPLIQLWPTKLQDHTVALNMSSTANVMDMLRFFYVNLFMPWDLDDDDDTDWKSKHLESRLKLHYDMKLGVIPKTTSDRLNLLLAEARRLQNKRERIEVQLENTEADTNCNQEVIDILTDIQLRLLEIKNEVEILENPLLRKAFIKRQNPKFMPQDITLDSRIWVIQDRELIENYIRFLEKVKLLYPKEKVTVLPDLPLTLENGGPKDVYILSKGNYYINNPGALECGGTIKGIEEAGSVSLVSSMEDIMFDFQGDHTLIENLTINANESQTAAVIRKGKVTFSNCKIFGKGESTIHQGIIVLAGSEVELKNCEIFGFHTAIVCNAGSNISMENTIISDVNFGLKIYDNSMVKVTKSVWRDCRDFAICMETEKTLEGNKHKIGDFELLKEIPEISTELISGINNNKGDVIIHHISQINAIEDLFSNDDPTVSGEHSDEDMQTGDEKNDELEKTVIENLRKAVAV